MRQVIMMMILLLQAAILLSSCTTYGMAQTMNNCSCEGDIVSTIGRKPTTLNLDLSPPSDLSGLFLNTHSQAPCNGRVVAWEFCYYVLQDNDLITEILAGVWRQQDNSEYHFLSNSLIDLSILHPGSDLQFACHRWNLTHDATFEVREGDVVGVFVNDTRMVHLHVLSKSERDNGIVKAVDNITSIESSVSKFVNTSYSLYLEAVMDTCQNPSITPSIYTSTTSTNTSLTTSFTTTNTQPTVPSTAASPGPYTTANILSTAITTSAATTRLSTSPTITSIADDINPTTSKVAIIGSLTRSIDVHSESVIVLHSTPVTDHHPTVGMSSPPMITTEPPIIINATSTPSSGYGKTWEYYVIGGLAASIILLIIIIAATIGRLYYLHKRSKGSVPVLIKKMKTGSQKVTRILMVSEEAGQHIGCTEIEAGDGDSPQHPIATPRQPPPPLPNTDGFQSSSEHGEFTSPMSPPPVVFAASFDIDQQSDDDQDRFIFKPNHQKYTHTKAQKIALVPSSDLKRSHSAVDAINVAYSSSPDTNTCPHTASTEYPYVLHAFEVVGKHPMHIGSLPNIVEHRFLEDEATNPRSNVDDNQGGTAYFQMNTVADDSNSDADDEPTYSYADRRQMTAKDLPTRRSKLPSIVEQATNQDYHYGEYPSAWNPTSQLLVQSITQSDNKYTTGDHTRSTEFSALPSNQVSPTQNLKQSSDMQDNALPPKPKLKPTIKPRKKPAHKVTSNGTALHSPAGMDKTGENHQPSKVISSNQVTENHAGAILAAQTPSIYMKLIETTKDDFHGYTNLFDGITELSELTGTSDLYPERAHPNEWCKQTKC